MQLGSWSRKSFCLGFRLGKTRTAYQGRARLTRTCFRGLGMVLVSLMEMLEMLVMRQRGSQEQGAVGVSNNTSFQCRTGRGPNAALDGAGTA